MERSSRRLVANVTMLLEEQEEGQSCSDENREQLNAKQEAP